MGKRLPVVHYSDLPSFDRLCLLTIAIRDLRDAKKAANGAAALSPLNVEQRELYYALADAAVVRYARAFKASIMPSGNCMSCLPQELPALVSVGAEDEAREFHARILAMRDEVVAHSDLRSRGIGLCPTKDDFGAFSKTVVAPAVTIMNLQPGNLTALARVAHNVANHLLPEFQAHVREQFPQVFEGDTVWILGGAPDALDRIYSVRRITE